MFMWYQFPSVCVLCVQNLASRKQYMGCQRFYKDSVNEYLISIKAEEITKLEGQIAATQDELITYECISW